MSMNPERRSLMSFLGCRVNVELDDRSTLIGRLVSFGQTSNLILTDVERVRPLKRRRGSSELLCYDTVIFVRGSSVVSVHHTSGITTDRSVVDTAAGRQVEVSKAIQAASQSLNAPLRTVRSISSFRSRQRQRAMPAGNNVSFKSESQIRWNLDGSGRIANFEMKVLRKDILRRLVEGPLYTLEECRVFLLELMRRATAWQEEELPYIMHLSDLHERLLPGASLAFQWPLRDTEPVPHADMPREEGALPMIATAVEEINRAVVRMIDRLWESRRERLLFAARLLQDIEPLLNDANGSTSSV